MKKAVLQQSNKMAYTTHQCIKTGYTSVMQYCRPPSCMQSQHFMAFKLGEVVRHVNSSFSFKTFATKAKRKKIDRYDFMFFHFQTKTPVSIILYACLYLNSMICVDKPKESLKTQLFCQLS